MAAYPLPILAYSIQVVIQKQFHIYAIDYNRNLAHHLFYDVSNGLQI